MSHPIKIIIVDDHEIVIDGLKAILHPGSTQLHRTGEDTLDEAQPITVLPSPFHIVGIAGSGEELIQWIANVRDVDVVIMDYYMSGMNGLDTAQAVKALRPSVKIIIFSMEESEVIINEAFAAHIDGYVTKGEGRRRLIEAIHRVQKGERVFPNLKLTAAPWLPEKRIKTGQQILSKREKEVACLIVNGHTTQQIADTLNIAFNTVEVHRNNIYRKLDISRLAELVRMALENKWCS